MADTNGTEQSRWRLSKDIPISVVLFLIAQTFTFGWFMATQSKTMGDLVTAQSKTEATRYTKEDAQREREFQEQKYLQVRQTTDELVRRIAVLEGQASELLNRARALPQAAPR